MTYYLLGRDGGGGKTCLPLVFFTTSCFKDKLYLLTNKNFLKCNQNNRMSIPLN